MGQKFDQFRPRTEEDKTDVARYEALKKSVSSLPDFYFGDISLRWEIGSPEKPWGFIMDKQVRSECTEVQKTIVNLLKKYEDA